MKSAEPGKNISGIELANVSANGLWLLVDGRELLLPFRDFPWLRDGSIAQLSNIERPQPHHLYWPDLDVDLALDSIEHPEQFPLISGCSSTRTSRSGSPPPPTGPDPDSS